jgi:hypothetical protein
MPMSTNVKLPNIKLLLNTFPHVLPPNTSLMVTPSMIASKLEAIPPVNPKNHPAAMMGIAAQMIIPSPDKWMRLAALIQ